MHSTNNADKYLTPILGPSTTVLLFKLGRRLAGADCYITTLQELSQNVVSSDGEPECRATFRGGVGHGGIAETETLRTRR